MGMDLGTLKFCLSALDMGYSMRSVCTLGRLNLFATGNEVAGALREHGRYPDDFWDRFPWRDPIAYADDVFRLLGFEEVHSMDNSDYEGASIVHDLNQPVPKDLHGRYDLVFDGGTLEHVFNFPVALAGAMSMVRPGGHFMSQTPANNQCGHGFYQFSPELFFRVFSPENGFELVRIYLIYKHKYYHVVDPAIVHGRVELITEGGALLMLHARRISDVEPFARAPQQSDYVASWKEHAASEDGPPADSRLKGFLRSRLSADQIAWVSRHLNRLRQRRVVRRWLKNARITNRRFYVPVERWDVPTSQVTGSATAPGAAVPQAAAPAG